MHDVLIIGAGQAGLALSVAMRQLGIYPVLLDRAPKDFEGPWATTARMETLRSPKELLGPALGLPSLSFRAWFIAQWGEAAWQQLDKIPRLQWMDYLRWYRHVTQPDVRNAHEVLAIRPQADGHVEVDVRANGTTTTWHARRVVLATGRDGLGGAQVPSFLQGVDRHRWAHSSDKLDYAQLKGLRIGVVGAGASAMDSAGTALENGAASVDLLIRRSTLPCVNKSKGSGVPGLVHGQFLLPDDWKWRIRHYINAQQVPPPHGSTLRVSRHPNAYFNFGCAVQQVVQHPSHLDVHTPHGVFALDFLIVATGFAIDWSLRPEFADIAPMCACGKTALRHPMPCTMRSCMPRQTWTRCLPSRKSSPASARGWSASTASATPLRCRTARSRATFLPSATVRASWRRGWQVCSTARMWTTTLPSCRPMPSPNWTARNGSQPIRPPASPPCAADPFTPCSLAQI